MAQQIQIPASLLAEIGRLVLESHITRANLEAAIAEIERLQKQVAEIEAAASAQSE